MTPGAAATQKPPSLAPGAHLGAYEIEAPIGAGGMGEVYRARDTRLGRSVAIKVLPPEVASDPSRRHRFEREARAVAALEHPHICVLHDIGSESGIEFLVMELLEGQTLAQRLKKGRIPRDEALRVAIEMAEALDAAHRQGITHRDLKPANVMLTKSGVKLLDFGLAKLRPAGPADGMKTATTEEPTSTETGVVLGTLPYMAPEQVEGREADARSDLWALGVVLYEMLSGRRAFAGSSAASLIASILEREPEPLSQLDELTPPALDRAVRRCLAKDPDGRWQSARDVADELKWVAEGAGLAEKAETRRAARWQAWPWVAAVALLTALVVGVPFSIERLGRDTPAVVRSQLGVTPAEAVGGARVFGQWIGGTRTSLALSPDGRQIVFVGWEAEQSRLYVRALDSPEATALAATEDAENPFFSPDGRWVGYWAREGLWKVSLAGGPPVSLCALPGAPPFGACWGADGRILFGAETGGLRSLPEEGGGEPVVVTSPGPGELSHRLPHVLPGGQTVLYTALLRSFAWTTARVVAESLRTGQRRVVVEGGADGRYVPTGHVVFLRLGRLMAVPFDEKGLDVTGSITGLQDGVAQAARIEGSQFDSGAGQFSVSESGSLAYLPGGVRLRTPTSLVRLGRDGTSDPLVDVLPDSDGVRVSPDGRRAVVGGSTDDGRALFLVDIERATRTSLGAADSAVWSPDGRALVMAREGQGLFRRDVDRGASEDVLLEESICWPALWLDEGSLIIVRGVPSHRRRGFQYDIERLEIDDGGVSTHSIVATEASEWGPNLSPDGRWLAYVSDESGRMEVLVRSYPDDTFEAHVSSDGGTSPSWSRDGTELFYSRRDRMMTVSVQATGGQGSRRLVLGRPRALFAYDALSVVINCEPTRCYDVAPDGRGFFAAARLEPPPPPPDVTHIHLVLNWAEELKARVPVGK